MDEHEPPPRASGRPAPLPATKRSGNVTVAPTATSAHSAKTTTRRPSSSPTSRAVRPNRGRLVTIGSPASAKTPAARADQRRGEIHEAETTCRATRRGVQAGARQRHRGHEPERRRGDGDERRRDQVRVAEARRPRRRPRRAANGIRPGRSPAARAAARRRGRARRGAPRPTRRAGRARRCAASPRGRARDARARAAGTKQRDRAVERHAPGERDDAVRLDPQEDEDQARRRSPSA